MKEEWKDIEGFEGYYQVSNMGRIKSVDRDVLYSNGRIHHYNEKIRVLCKDKDGYQITTLNKDGKSYSRRVHQLVACAFLPNPDNLPSINHIDEDKTNNRVDNLEWCSVYYNNHYNDRYKRVKAHKKGIILFNVVTGAVKKMPSVTQTAKELNVGSGAITAATDKRGKTIKSWLIFSSNRFNGLSVKQSLAEYNKHRPRGIVVEFVGTADKKFYTTEYDFCRENSQYPASVNRYLRGDADIFNKKYVIRYALPAEELLYENGQLLDY